MTDIYLSHLVNQNNAGIELFAHYLDTGKWTATARFGARRHYDDSEAPKYLALRAILDQAS